MPQSDYNDGMVIRDPQTKKMRREYKARRAAILREYGRLCKERGKSFGVLAALGRKYGISRERVRQIVALAQAEA
jgi:DNA-directed RNA polymerase sigma subunit (sigma70/sigma32)